MPLVAEQRCGSQRSCLKGVNIQVPDLTDAIHEVVAGEEVKPIVDFHTALTLDPGCGTHFAGDLIPDPGLAIEFPGIAAHVLAKWRPAAVRTAENITPMQIKIALRDSRAGEVPGRIDFFRMSHIK